MLSIPLTFFQYYVFHYSHLALTEILSSMCILAGVVFCYKALQEETLQLRYALLSATSLAMSYYLKIQYAYILFLTPTYLIFSIAYTYILEKRWNIPLLKLLGWHTAIQTALFLFYVITWYLPNKTLYDYILADQTGDRYVSWAELGPLLDYYYHDIFLHPKLKPFTLLFFLSTALGLVLLILKRVSLHFKILFFLLLLWVLLELHKLPMRYLPSRYLISAYIAMGTLITLVLRESLLRFSEKAKWSKLILPLTLLPVLCVVIININVYIETYQRRKFSITQINESLQQNQSGRQANCRSMGACVELGVERLLFSGMVQLF